MSEQSTTTLTKSEKVGDSEFETEDLFGVPDFEDANGIEREYIRDGFIGMDGDLEEGYYEIDRYWAYEPYSMICILKNPQENTKLYHTIEPVLDEEEQITYNEIDNRLRQTLRNTNIREDYKEDYDMDMSYDQEIEHKHDVITENAYELALENKLVSNRITLEKILYMIRRNFVRFGKIDPLMNDYYIEDISCNGDGVPIFIVHNVHENIMTDIKFKSQELSEYVKQLAQRSGQHISVSEPQIDASLPDGSRINMSLGTEVTPMGSSFTIRKFNETPFTPVDLIHYDTFNPDMLAYLWIAIQNERSLIFAGGTASGKTTSMNAVSLFIPPSAKIVSIEDTPELQLPHLNWLPQITRSAFAGDEGGEIDEYELLEAALRQRPEYIVVGEVRGEEAQTLFQAMSTGHTTYSTLHADTPEEAINRLRNDPINVPDEILKSLDILSIQKRFKEGETADRRCDELVELKSEDSDISVDTVFDYTRGDDTFERLSQVSSVEREVRNMNDWSRNEYLEERERRKDILQHMEKHDIRGYDEVIRVLQMYMIDKDRIINELESPGPIDPDKFDSIKSIKTQR